MLGLKIFARKPRPIPSRSALATGQFKNKKSDATFRQVIGKQKILIVDPSGTSRSAIFRMICQAGVKPFQVLLAPNFATAKEQLDEHKPEIVISEYRLGHGPETGLDLLAYQRTKSADWIRSVFILVTSNSSQGLVARAAEDEVDGFVIKPFSPAKLKEVLVHTVERAAHPPVYLEQIQEGKRNLLKGQVESAELNFASALKLAEKPALACYYLGQIKAQREQAQEAAEFFKEGLKHNELNYKCLVSLFDLYLKEGNRTEAYEVGKKLILAFPTRADRMASVIKLAVENHAYKDIEIFGEGVLSLEEQPVMLKITYAAALIVAAKHYLRADQSSKAVELLWKAAQVSQYRTRLLHEIIQALIDFKLAKEADEFLRKYPKDQTHTQDYLMLDFEIANLVYPPSVVLARGRELISRGIGNERMYEIMIARALASGVHYAAEIYAHEAAVRFPDLAVKFENMIRSIRAANAPA